MVGLRPEDAAVEIGPGLGDLTRAIARTARRTVALEVDRGLVELLREEGLPESVELRHADALRTDLGSIARELSPPVVLLGNLPYGIAGRLLGSLLAPRNPFRRMGLMVQAEVADRILAKPRSRRYGVLSVWASLWTQASVGLKLGPEVFEPRPRVRSVACFMKKVPSRRRKMLRAALRGVYSEIDEAMNEAEIDPTRRPEALEPGDFVRLANALARRSEGS